VREGVGIRQLLGVLIAPDVPGPEMNHSTFAEWHSAHRILREGRQDHDYGAKREELRH
jgi:hypothetical protein